MLRCSNTTSRHPKLSLAPQFWIPVSGTQLSALAKTAFSEICQETSAASACDLSSMVKKPQKGRMQDTNILFNLYNNIPFEKLMLSLTASLFAIHCSVVHSQTKQQVRGLRCSRPSSGSPRPFSSTCRLKTPMTTREVS